MKKLSLIFLALLAFGPTAWAQNTQSIYMSNGDSQTIEIGDTIETVSVFANSTDAFVSGVTLTAPAGCFLRLYGTVTSGNLSIYFEGDSYNSSHGDFEFWVNTNQIQVGVDGNSVNLFVNVAVYNPKRIDTEEKLWFYLNHGSTDLKLIADITLNEYLTIGQTSSQIVTLDLNGHTMQRTGLTSAQTNGHVIEVFGEGNLTLQNGTISGGWATNGGGICNYGTVTLNNVTITDCKAENGGGIINNDGQSLTINGGSITNCQTNAGGGAIVNHGTAEINGCTMSDNTATTRGGAIWSDGTVTVSSGTISSNIALAGGNGGDGGAIHIQSGTATLTGVTITNNESKTEGGALYINSGTTTLNDVTITNNTAKDAGGIYVKAGSTLNLGGDTGSILSGNNSSEHGGGGIVNYGTVALSGIVNITDNICHTYGGGIWNNGTLNMQDNIHITGNGRTSGLTTNVYLTTGKVITVTGSLGSSKIGIGIQGYNGIVTSDLSGNGDLSNFSNDFAPITELSLNESGEAKFTTPEFGVYYVERGWDTITSTVTETLKLREPEVDHPLTYLQHEAGWWYPGTEPGSSDFFNLEGGQWYIVKNTDNNPDAVYFCITVTASEDNPANLILCDGAKLESPIILNEGHALNIFGQMEGTGELDAHGFRSHEARAICAGIGAGNATTGTGTYQPGKLTIHGGTITATGSDGAGIGGMSYRFSSSDDYFVSNGGDVTIYGGTITAKGDAAGIGGGTSEQTPITNHNVYGGNCGTIKIYGGTIHATGNKGAGIGDGDGWDGGSDGGTIEIYGGTVEAICTHASDGETFGGGAGIGGGKGRDGGTITINGGNIVARGRKYGAGIGGGKNGNGGSVTINGGTITAYAGADAAGIGSGEQNEGTKHGGTITINGGIVEAHGGEHGAGIGGGQDASGANVTIWGGEVRAYGGTDAAGIGSGERYTASSINGGSLTVHGGKVFADGSGWGAGIGGGEDANGATVIIYDGEVTAWAGADAGKKNGSAIGSEDGDGHRGSLTIPDKMMVKAGQNPESASLFPYETRVPACYFRPYAEIKTCTHDDGVTYTVSGTEPEDTHTMHCKHCKVTTTEEHNFVGTECSVCHVYTDGIKSLTIYLPVINSGGGYNDGIYRDTTYYMVKNSEYFLPSAPLANEPRGMKFAGWKNGDDTGLTTFIAGASEQLIAANEIYTLNDNLTLTARYRKVSLFNTSGDWNTVGNWYWGEIPGANDTIVIAAEAIIPAGCTAQARNRIDLDLTGTITIKDGGQFINGVGVWATVEKNIAGHDGSAENGWYFITHPTTNSIKPSLSNGFLTEDSTKYDLYYLRRADALLEKLQVPRSELLHRAGQRLPLRQRSRYHARHEWNG